MTFLDGPTLAPHVLAAHLDDPDLVVLDASIPPVAKTVVRAVTAPACLPGSRRFDFDGEIRDRATSLPHMLPSPAEFTAHARRLGIAARSTVVVYDDVGVYASPRAWWMLRVMGHQRVAVLDGGLPAWRRAGLPTVATHAAAPRPGDFTARLRPELLADAAAVAEALGDAGCVVLDARSAGRFAGREGEPRPGLRGGHMPGAVNLPFPSVLADGGLLPAASLRQVFAPHAGKRLLYSCGSGVTACILALAAEVAGMPAGAVYDGSWAEWGHPDSGRPVVPKPSTAT